MMSHFSIFNHSILYFSLVTHACEILISISSFFPGLWAKQGKYLSLGRKGWKGDGLLLWV